MLWLLSKLRSIYKILLEPPKSEEEIKDWMIR